MDHAIIAYVREASEMGNRLGLFGSDGYDIWEERGNADVTDEAATAKTFAAWGVFNWLT